MAEVRFIKTVAFGGYDKTEVIRRIEYLNSQVFSLKNELRETKLMLDGYKKGTEAEKNADTVLAGERAKLTQVQVQNDTLTTKLKATEDENHRLTEEIEKLKTDISDLNDQLIQAKNKIAATEANDEALALSAVFIEAKKSADMLIESAKEKSSEIKKESASAAEKTISDANDEALKIIHEAEDRAAETIAEAKNNSNAMEVASNNLKVVMLGEVSALSENIASIKDMLEKIGTECAGKLEESQRLLDKTEDTLIEGGVPVFVQPERIEPEYKKHEMPKRESEEEAEKRKSGLDKLKNMAASIGSKKKDDTEKDSSEKKSSEETKPDEVTEPEKKEKDSAGAEKSAEEEKKTEPAAEKKSGGKNDLAAIAARAKALQNKK